MQLFGRYTLIIFKCYILKFIFLRLLMEHKCILKALDDRITPFKFEYITITPSKMIHKWLKVITCRGTLMIETLLDTQRNIFEH